MITLQLNGQIMPYLQQSLVYQAITSFLKKVYFYLNTKTKQILPKSLKRSKEYFWWNIDQQMIFEVEYRLTIIFML